MKVQIKNPYGLITEEYLGLCSIIEELGTKEDLCIIKDRYEHYYILSRKGVIPHSYGLYFKSYEKISEGLYLFIDLEGKDVIFTPEDLNILFIGKFSYDKIICIDDVLVFEKAREKTFKVAKGRIMSLKKKEWFTYNGSNDFYVITTGSEIHVWEGEDIRKSESKIFNPKKFELEEELKKEKEALRSKEDLVIIKKALDLLWQFLQTSKQIYPKGFLGDDAPAMDMILEFKYLDHVKPFDKTTFYFMKENNLLLVKEKIDIEEFNNSYLKKGKEWSDEKADYWGKKLFSK